MAEETAIPPLKRIKDFLKMLAALPIHQVASLLLYAKARNTIVAHILIIPAAAGVIACWAWFWVMVLWGIGKLTGLPVF